MQEKSESRSRNIRPGPEVTLPSCSPRVRRSARRGGEIPPWSGKLRSLTSKTLCRRTLWKMMIHFQKKPRRLRVSEHRVRLLLLLRGPTPAADAGDTSPEASSPSSPSSLSARPELCWSAPERKYSRALTEFINCRLRSSTSCAEGDALEESCSGTSLPLL